MARTSCPAPHPQPLSGPTGIAAALALALAGCAMPYDRGLDSVHQPVVERTRYALDLGTGPGGLAYGEQQRLDGWLEALGARTGDRLTLEAAADDIATRNAVTAIAARHGLLVDTAPTGSGEQAAPGSVRVLLARSTASVPGCPDWSAKSDSNLANGTTSNFGCAVNGNFAAMVADPEHLLHGAGGDGDGLAATGSKAIAAWRDAPPTGTQGLKQASTGAQGSQQQ
ncbi:MAG: CpaD family pilus assembly lipoprotein [Novosphingobium sp.]